MRGPSIDAARKAAVFLVLLACVGCGSSAGAPSGPTVVTTRVLGLTGNLAFGDVPVGSAAVATFTIGNSGNSTLTVGRMNGSNDLESVLAADWLNGPVGPGASQQIRIQFSPLFARAYSGAIIITSDATAGSTTIPVSGTGTPTSAVPVPGYYLWGGPGASQFLGYFTCLFCVESDPDSTNNHLGRYGSQFSLTSIRNQLSQYGSVSSTYSSCNPFATAPPQVFDSSGTVPYGELTINQSRSTANPASAIFTWLATTVCNH